MTPREAERPSDDELDFKGFLTNPEADPWRLGHLILLIVGFAFFLWIYRISGSLPFTLSLAVLFAILVVIGYFWAKRRASTAESLLTVMAIAAEKGMPLAPAVAAMATQYRGLARRRIIGLASTLNSGKSLSESFSIVSRLLPRDATLLARVGEEAGVLPKAFRQAAEARAAYYPAFANISTRLMYILYVLMFIQVIVGFITYFVMPKIEAIFRDFGLVPPAVTLAAMQVTAFFVRYAPFAVLFYLFELFLILYLPLRIMGALDLEIPWIDRIFRRRHSALILRALSLFVDAGKPIEQGLDSLARNYPTSWVRRRLAQVSEEVRHGGDWCVILWRRGLISAATGGLLASAKETGNLAWVMRELANTSDRRALVRLQAIIQLLFPILILLIGLFVLFVVLAYFSPLVMLIDRLAG